MSILAAFNRELAMPQVRPAGVAGPRMPAKHVDREWLEERIAIRVEHIRHPTPKDLHDALNATIADLKERYGELDIPQWPRYVTQ